MQGMQQWQSAGQYFEFEGHKIFYRSEAKHGAPVLLLIHCFPTSSWDWCKIWSDLSQHFELLSLDMLGFGFSDKPRQKYSIMQQADIFEALLKQKNIEQFHILAHDYGDTVAQELLARHENSGRLLSIVFSNGGLFPEMHRPVFLQKLLLSPIGFLVGKLTNYNKFEKNFDHICARKLSEKELESLWELLNCNNGTHVIHRLISYIPERRKYRERWVGGMQKTNVPLHLIAGLLDPISGEHMAAHYEKLIPNADITRLEGVGHYPQLENATEFINGALCFWRNQNVLG